MTEAQLQRAVIAFLRLAAPEAVAFAIPNAARRSATGRATNAVAGLLSGAPDLILVHDGRALFLELKSAKGRVSPQQAEAHARLRAAGAFVGIIRTLEDVETALDLCGVPLRARVTRGKS
jgi:hypothetical protein